MKETYLSPKAISQTYNIPLRTIYWRVHSGYYKMNEKNEISTNDVEKIIAEPIKRGRRWKIEK